MKNCIFCKNRNIDESGNLECKSRRMGKSKMEFTQKYLTPNTDLNCDKFTENPLATLFSGMFQKIDDLLNKK